MLALGTLISAFGTVALAADERAVSEMLQRSETVPADGMVTKADFIKLMEKRFDAMDEKARSQCAPSRGSWIQGV